MWCNSDGDRCSRCGRKAAKGRRLCVTEMDRAKTIQRLMHGHRIKIPAPRLGDRVQSLLSAVGVTEERVKRLFGVKDCKCSDRKKTLNDVSEEVAFRVESFVNLMADFFLGDMVSEQAERMARELTKRLNGDKDAADAKTK